jgi:hypothetical protein
MPGRHSPSQNVAQNVLGEHPRSALAVRNLLRTWQLAEISQFFLMTLISSHKKPRGRDFRPSPVTWQIREPRGKSVSDT